MFLVKLVAKEEHTTDRMQYILKISQTFSRKSRRERKYISLQLTIFYNEDNRTVL